MLKFTVLLLFCFLISACASMNESECLTADWGMLGYEDGSQGRDSTTLSSRREACAEHGITPIMEDYRHGYSEGLGEFCTEFNGFHKGSQGYQYKGICRGFGETEFLQGYRDGQHLYSLRATVDEIQHRMDHNRYEVERLEKKIGKLQTQIISDDTTSKQRAALLNDIRSLEKKVGALESNIEADLYLRVVAEQEYEDFRQNLPY